MTTYMCFGANSKVIYAEGSKPDISKVLLTEFPTYRKKKKEGISGHKDILVDRLFIEPLKIRKEADYYAELDSEK